MMSLCVYVLMSNRVSRPALVPWAPLQLTTFNVMGASCGLFDVSMDI